MPTCHSQIVNQFGIVVSIEPAPFLSLSNTVLVQLGGRAGVRMELFLGLWHNLENLEFSKTIKLTENAWKIFFEDSNRWSGAQKYSIMFHVM